MKNLGAVSSIVILFLVTVVVVVGVGISKMVSQATDRNASTQLKIHIPPRATLYDITYYKGKAKYVLYEFGGKCYMWSKTDTKNSRRQLTCPEYIEGE